MEEITGSRNHFEALCALAAKENWCWKITCTTCGHMYFRYGFLELTQGKHPDSPHWLSGKKYHHSLQRLLGPLPVLGGLSLESQRILADLLSGASLEAIRSKAHFPDWLGYLGLGFLYCANAEEESRQLTNVWTPQLIGMVEAANHGMPMAKNALLDILTDRQQHLTWTDLEGIENDILG